MKLLDHWFYGRPTAESDVYAFDAEEALHATRALRLGVGDDLQWLDGRGTKLTGVIQQLSRGGFTAVAKTRSTVAEPTPLRLGVGTLHDATRLEWLVEKATELGVTELVLLDTQRVQRTRHRLARLEAKALAAMKQSGRAWLPTIREQSLSGALLEFAAEDEADALRLLAHCYAERPRSPLWQVLAKAAGLTSTPTHTGRLPGVWLLIGPEGDFAPGEIDALEASGFRSISLGAARLRSETATIAALSLLSLRVADLG